MSRISDDIEDGDYHTHIRFLEDVTQRDVINPLKEGSQASISAPLAYEALIPAIISHGAVSAKVDLKNATISKDPESGKIVIKTIVTREGNGQGTAYLDTEYVAPDGNSIVATPRRTVYLYREIGERVKDIDFSLAEDVVPGGSFRLTLYDSPTKDASPVKQVNLALP